MTSKRGPDFWVGQVLLAFAALAAVGGLFCFLWLRERRAADKRYYAEEERQSLEHRDNPK